MTVETTTSDPALYKAYTGTVQEVLDALSENKEAVKNLKDVKFVWDDTNSKLIAIITDNTS